MNISKLFLILLFPLSLISSDIAVVTMAIGDDYQEAVQTSIKNKQLYCKKHNYDFYCLKKGLDPSKNLTWSKLKAIKNIMKSNQYKWIFWIDADALIMNQGIKVEDLIDENYNVIVPVKWSDANNSSHYALTIGNSLVPMQKFGEDIIPVVQTSVFLMKCCPWNLKLIDQLFSRTETPQGWPDQLTDNKAFLLEHRDNVELRRKTKIMAGREMNSHIFPIKYNHPNYPSPKIAKELKPIFKWQEGDFVLHFHCLQTEINILKELLDSFSNKAIDNPYAIDLKHYLGIYGFDDDKITNAQINQSGLFSNLNIDDKSKNSTFIGFENCFLIEQLLRNYSDISINVVGNLDSPFNKALNQFFQRFYKSRYNFIQLSTLLELEDQIPEESLIFINKNLHSSNELINTLSRRYKVFIIDKMQNKLLNANDQIFQTKT